MTEYTARPATMSRLVSLRNLRSEINPPARISHRWPLLGELQSLQKDKTCDRNGMSVMQRGVSSLEIIALKINEPAVCVKTTTIREIRGPGPAMPVPQAPRKLMGVMNLRGSVIPIINLATKLGMAYTEATERSAIVVAEVHGTAMGLLVDSVSDILTVSTDMLQAVPELGSLADTSFFDGIIVHPSGMICFLYLTKMFDDAIPQPRYGT
jgi:purine-binding chemotaxis protein CheW